MLKNDLILIYILKFRPQLNKYKKDSTGQAGFFRILFYPDERNKINLFQAVPNSCSTIKK